MVIKTIIKLVKVLLAKRKILLEESTLLLINQAGKSIGD